MVRKRKLDIRGLHWDVVLLISMCPLYNAFIGPFGVFQILTVPLLLLFFYYRTNKKYDAIVPIKGYVVIYIIFLIQDALLTLLYGQKDLFQEMKVHIIVLLMMLHNVNFKTSNVIYPLMAIVGVLVGYYMLKNQNMVSDIRLSLQIGDVLQDPNWIAIFLFAPFCLGLYFINYNRFFLKCLGLFLIIFPLYVVFLTGSRGALFGLIAATIIWVITSYKQSGFTNLFLFLIVAIVVAFVFITYLLPNVDIGIIERYTGERIMDNERNGIWTDLVAEYLNGSLFDILFGRGPMSCVRDLGYSAHNMILEQVFQYGLLGLVLMLSFFFRLFKDTVKCNNQIGLYIITALFTLSLTTPIWGHIYFMVPIAMIAYMNKSQSLSMRLKQIMQ